MNAKCLFLYSRLVFWFERSNLIVCQGLQILMRAPNIMISSFGIRNSTWKANLISQKCTLFGDAIKDAVVMQFSNKICWISTRIHVTLCVQFAMSSLLWESRINFMALQKQIIFNYNRVCCWMMATKCASHSLNGLFFLSFTKDSCLNAALNGVSCAVITYL